MNTGKNHSDLISLNLRSWLSHNWKPFAVLTFFVLAAYFNSLNNAFISDDISGIVENKHMGSFFDIRQQPLSFMRPFLYLLIYRLWGLQPIAFHSLNLLFHLGTVCLVYLILNLLSGSSIAFFTASIFAVHPILTESVTWISGGGYCQYAFFFLLCFLAYIFSCDSRRSPLTKKTAFTVSILAFFLSLSSSEKAIVLPLTVFLFELCFGNLRKNWKKIISFFVLSIIWGLMFFERVGQRVITLETTFYQKPGIHNPLQQIPIAITSYLKLILWPKDLTFYHSELIFNQTAYFAILVIFILFLFSLVYSFFKKREVFFWLSFFIVSLLPTLTPLKVAWIVAERYVYLGTLGIVVILAMFLQKIGNLLKNRKVSYYFLAILLIGLSYRTIVRNMDWENQDTLWLATAKTSPSSPQNHNNLGDLYARRGELEKAADEFKTAIKLQPNYGDAYHNLANIYQQMGEKEEALANYRKAISFNPNLWQSYRNLTVLYFEEGNYQEAQENIIKAIQINPQDADLYVSLSIIYLKEGNTNKAREFLSRAINIDPQNQRAKQILLSL